MNIDNIKSKIKKLLALSEDNPSDAESYVALQKAQELMALYKLEQKDISEEYRNQECVKVKTTLSYGTRSSDHYLDDLAGIIANNFCCVNYISTPRGSRTHYVCFMGMKDDVDIAQEVIHTANMQIIRGYNRVYNEVCKEHNITYLPAKYFNPLKTGYIEGYLAGLKHALESQKEKHQEWGLVLVTPKEAQDYMSNLKSVDFGGTIYVDNTYYDKGYTDGSNFNLNKKIDNKGQERITE